MFLKVKSGEKLQTVRISEPESEESTPNEIIISIIKQLDLYIQDSAIQLKDRDGVINDFDVLPEVIKQYRCCSWFFLEFCLGETAESTTKINFKKELECYLRNGDFCAIFKEYEGQKTLSDSSRRCLVREATNFLRQQSGNYPNREDKIALAEAFIYLFPSYKVENSNFGGIDLFYNPAANTGYLVAKLKNFNWKRRKLKTTSGKAEHNVESYSGSGSDKENIAIDQEDLHFFKNCLVRDQFIIKEKLQQTLKARIKYCTAGINVLQAIPIFLYDSSLILFDFKLRYGAKAGGQSHEGFSESGIDVLPFLYLLKLLPSTAAEKEQKLISHWTAL